MLDLSLPAFDSHRWMNCAGSVKLQASHIPPVGDRNESKEEGKTCHKLSMRMINMFANPQGDAPNVGEIDSNGVVITEEFYQFAKEYVNDVFGYCNPERILSNVQVESSLPADWIKEGQIINPDAWVHNEAKKELVVWDAKFGHGIVEVFENWQLLIGAICATGQIGGMDSVDTIRLRIVQPRAFHQDGIIREWVLTSQELQEYYNQIWVGSNTALSPNATCNSGGHCKYCPARHACGTLQQNVYNAIDCADNAASVSLQGDNLSNEIRLLRHSKTLIDARLSGLEAQASAELKAGGSLAHFSLDQTYGRKKWNKDIPAESLFMMGDLMNVDIRKPQEPITPSQAIKKGIDENVISGYSFTPSGGLKLVEKDVSKARQIFKKD